jgi:peptidoglycan hydrolase-like protein with peptidoglycan-binding domain
LIDSGKVEHALRKGSRSRGAIRALQTILHELGYDKQLNWEKYGADGDYGGGTTRAVRAFASQRRIDGGEPWSRSPWPGR